MYIKYLNQTMKFTPLTVGLTPFYLWVSLHHLFAVHNLIFRCFTGSQMTILSKSNYRVRLNVNMNITQSYFISILGKAITLSLG